MPTRRQTLVGMLALGFGSAAASASAFTSSTEPDSDLRVVVESELSLVPAREDVSQYFRLDSDGEIDEFVFKKLNKRAITEFADFASIVNDGDIAAEEIKLSFTADEADGEVAETLSIVGNRVSVDDGMYKLLPRPRTLGPGKRVTFGIKIDFLSDGVPDAIADSETPVGVTLVIDPIRA